MAALQACIVAVVVALAAAYSLWTLMPAAWRRPLARRLLRLPVLARWPKLQAAAAASGGCSGCGGGCATPARAAGDTGSVMHWPRRRR